MKKGRLISLEGIDGCGKTSLIKHIQHYLRAYPVIMLREPGGTVVSEAIRKVLLDVGNDAMTPRTEAFLYASARSQVVEELINPALASGTIVLADRFLDSTIAYQGYGRRMDLQFLAGLNQLCTGGLLPDLTLLLDIDPEDAERRRHHLQPDRLEKNGLDFYWRVRRGYLSIASQEPQRIKVIDASQDMDRVIQEAISWVDRILDCGGNE